MKKNQGVQLYVIQQPSGLLKIGVTNDMAGRMATIESNSGHRVTVLGVYTIRDFERHLHSLCAEHRTLGEWFAPSALSALIAVLPRIGARTGRAGLAICSICQQPFPSRTTRPNPVCRSELCRKKQAQLAGTAAAKHLAELGGRGPNKKQKIFEIKCPICGINVRDRRPRKTCSSLACASEYGRRTAQAPIPGVNGVGVRKPCSIEGCARPSAARGWCSTHYMRWRKWGDTASTLKPRRASA